MKQNEINSWLIVLILFAIITGAWYIYTSKPVLLSKFQLPGPKYINIQSSSPEKPLIIPTLFMLLVFGVLYFLVYRNVVDRTVLFVLGAVIVVLCGYYLKFYDWPGAWRALKSKIDVLYFLVGMNIITVVLDEGGFFGYLSKKITVVTRGNKWKIMVVFCLATYVFSLLVNNLTTIMVLVPMIFSLSRLLKFNPKPFIVAMIIASNLGGASTMIGDFPNILIGTEMGVPFLQFILYMMPPCLIQLAILLVYVRLSQRSLFKVREKQADKGIMELLGEVPRRKEKFFQKVEESLKNGLEKPKIVKHGLFILGVLLVLFFISDLIHVPPAIIAMSGGI
jgi:Na+/H+ antiporter NhaD/arsenite permease-like protein